MRLHMKQTVLNVPIVAPKIPQIAAMTPVALAHTAVQKAPQVMPFPKAAKRKRRGVTLASHTILRCQRSMAACRGYYYVTIYELIN